MGFLTLFFLLTISRLLLLLSGDVEAHPGPVRRGLCRALYSNVRGLHANLAELSVASANYDLLFCNESLVSVRRHVSELRVPGFSKPLLRLWVPGDGSRGMAVYIREGFPAYRQSCFECSCHEVMVVRVCSRLMNYYFIALYRVHNADDSIYDCLLYAMGQIQSRDSKAAFVFVGDFNAHHQEWLQSVSRTDAHGRAAYDFSVLSGCDQLVRESTHKDGNRLDLVMTDVPEAVDVAVGAPLGTSDHSHVSMTVQLTHPRPNDCVRREVYLKQRADWTAIEDAVARLPWGRIVSQDNPIDLLNSHTARILDRMVPKTVVRVRSWDRPWFDAECRLIFDEKQQAYRRWCRSRNPEDWARFTELRRTAHLVFDAAEQRHHDRAKESLLAVSNAHRWWSTLKGAVFGADPALPPLVNSLGGVVSGSAEKAELLSAHFDSKQSRDPILMPVSCHPEPQLTSLAFRSSVVKALLLDLDSYGGVDPVGMFPLFYKRVAGILAPKLSAVFRKLVREGSFPQCWRKGHITPIPKGGPSSRVEDYRPITITPVLSKVFEKLVSFRLGRFAEQAGILPPGQFAYRKSLGCCDALLSLVSPLQKALDRGEEARLVQIDFSAAFDRVNHELLLYLLQDLGVCGVLLSIIREFLTNRTQRVAVDGKLSASVDVVSGVPQGSVLGPLLFILYTRGLFPLVENNLISYADDCSLFAVIPNPGERSVVCDSINRDLERIHSWCASYGMKLNAGKTKTMLVSRSRTPDPPHPPLVIEGVPLKESESLVVLGVTLDSKFIFEDHLRGLASRVASKIGILRRVRSVFQDAEVVTRCFYTFVLPILEYCSPVWGSAATCHLNLLERLVRRACEVCGVDSLVDLVHRRRVAQLCVFYKLFGNVDHLLHDALPPLAGPRRATRAAVNAHQYGIVLERCRTSQYQRCFVPSSVRLWNGLPERVFEPGTLSGFKSAVNSALRV